MFGKSLESVNSHCLIFADPLCKLAEMIKQREPKLTDSVLIIGSEGQDILIQGARFFAV